MKNVVTAALVTAAVVLFGLTSNVLAAGSNTLLVYASDARSLDQIINSDTTNAGLPAHSVYELVSLDTTYLYLDPIVVKTNMTIIGVPGSDGRPPCVQPGLRSDGSLPAEMCLVSGNQARVTLKNLYIFGLSVTNTYNGGPVMLVAADSAKVYMDSVVTDETHSDIIDYSGNYDDYFITHCKFRNGVWPNNWFSTMVINTVYPTSNPADSVVMDDNTLFCLNSDAMYLGVNGPTNYVEFDHNTFVYNFQFTFQFSYTVWHLQIENNLFYCVYAGGVKYNQYHFFYYQPGFHPVSAIELDTMRFASQWDSAYANNPWLAESKQTAIVENNDFFEPQKLTDFWTAWNDTATIKSDSLITCEWMNPETQNMFNDKTHWPGYSQSNNLVGVDPGFGPSIAGVLDGSGPNTGVGLLQYIREVRTGKETTDEWGYDKQQVSGNNWIPQWPLPEAADMQYTNATVKNNSNDGLPLGDPSWFGISTAVKQPTRSVPTSFSLSDNYPNPFNPSTVIKVGLNRGGVMSLRVYNVLGQLVKIVDQGYKPAGQYSYDVNMDNFASGVYFYTLQQGPNVITKKMLLLK